jgi:hypothetical protein
MFNLLGKMPIAIKKMVILSFIAQVCCYYGDTYIRERGHLSDMKIVSWATPWTNVATGGSNSDKCKNVVFQKSDLGRIFR